MHPRSKAPQIKAPLNLLDTQAQAWEGRGEPGLGVAALHPGLQSTCWDEKTAQPAFGSETLSGMIKKRGEKTPNGNIFCGWRRKNKRFTENRECKVTGMGQGRR